MWRGSQAPPQRQKRPVQQPLIAASIAHRAVIEQRAIAKLGDDVNASLSEIFARLVSLSAFNGAWLPAR